MRPEVVTGGEIPGLDLDTKKPITDNSTIGDSLSMEYKATLDNIGSVEMSSDVVQDILKKVFPILILKNCF